MFLSFVHGLPSPWLGEKNLQDSFPIRDVMAVLFFFIHNSLCLHMPETNFCHKIFRKSHYNILRLVLTKICQADKEVGSFVLIILACNLPIKCGFDLRRSFRYDVRASSTSLLAFPASSIKASSVLKQSFLFSSRCSNLGGKNRDEP